MEKALAYIRVSTDRQVKDGSSLTTQKRRVEDYIASKGYELDRLFMEEGETAKTDNRPVLQEMLGYAKKNRGRIQVLIFPKVDRFARYAEDYHFLKRYLRNLGIRVESCDEHFDDSPSGRFMESLLAATAQFDNDVRAERAKSGMKEAVSQGRWVWGAPRGFRNVRIDNKATIEPDPVKGPLVAEAFERLAWKGFRLEDVRNWLSLKGVIVSRSQFHKMLYSKTYIGVIEAFGVTVQAVPPFLPLVSEATFFKAQQSLRQKKSPKVYQRDREDFPLRGTMKCVCGRLLTASWSRGRSRTYPYYRCMLCPRMNLPTKMVNVSFISELADVKLRFGLTPRVRKELVDEWQKERAADQARSVSLEREVSSMTELQKAIALKNAQGVIPDSVAREQIEEIGQKISEKRVQLEETRLGEQDIERVVDFADDFLSGLEAFWRASDLESKKHIQAFFFPDGATINSNGLIRTAKQSRFTGLRVGVSTHLTRLARPSSKTTNPVAHKQQKANQMSSLIRFLLRLYREFADPYASNDCDNK